MSHSIPDKEALSTIWQKVKDRSIPLKPLTKAEYDVLDETSKNADVVYLVQSADGFSLVYKGENLFSERGQSNPNLLDNWYFVDPINQMGQTEYPQTVYDILSYAIDRWYFYAGASMQHTLAVGDECITLTCGGTGIPPWIRQIFEGNFDPAQKVTLSVLAKSNEAERQFALKLSNLENLDDGTAIKDFTFSKSNQYELFSMTISPYMKTAAEIIGSSIPGVSISVMAVKLELGSQQTLAHQDSDGNWVLNDPPPNKALELAKCQRYQYIVNSQKNQYAYFGSGFIKNATTFLVPMTIPNMRATPTILFEGELLGETVTSDWSVKVSSVSLFRYSENSVLLECVVLSAFPSKENAMYLVTNSTAKIIFDANL